MEVRPRYSNKICFYSGFVFWGISFLGKRFAPSEQFFKVAVLQPVKSRSLSTYSRVTPYFGLRRVSNRLRSSWVSASIR